MAFFDFLKRNNINLEHKEAPRVHMQQTMPYHERSDNYKSYAKEGYQQNAEQSASTLFNKLSKK